MPTVVCRGKEVELVLETMAAPIQCPSCHTAIRRRILSSGGEGAIHECPNTTCPAKSQARIKNWIKKIGILGIGDTILQVMIETFDMRSPVDLYRLDLDRLSKLPIGNGKLGEARAKQIIEQLNSTREMPLNVFIGSLSIPLLGRDRADLIMKAMPGQFDTIEDWLSGKLLDDSIKTQAHINNMAEKMQNGIKSLTDVIRDLSKYIIIKKEEAPQTKYGKLVGKVFCFTGKIEKVDKSGNRYTRAMMQQEVIANGGAIADDIKSGVTDLVQADKNSVSSKSQKAKKLGVNIMSEEEFFQLAFSVEY